MTVNPFVGNRYSHFLPNLMISSSLPSAGTVRQRTNFRVYNFEFTPVGGCQQEVNANDETLFALDAFDASAFLKLTGPATTFRDQVVILTVADGQTVDGAPVN